MCRQLLDDKEVLFSGYRVPHPLEPAIQLKVQTRTDNPGPTMAVQQALNSLKGELEQFDDRFKAELNRIRGAGARGYTGGDPMDTL